MNEMPLTKNSRLSVRLHVVANIILAFYLFEAFVQVERAVAAHGSLVMGSIYGGDALLRGVMYWLLLKGAEWILHSTPGHCPSGSDKARSLALYLKRFLLLFPFAVIVVNIPSLLQMYQLLLAFQPTINRLFVVSITILLGGLGIGLEILFWYFVLSAVKLLVERCI